MHPDFPEPPSRHGVKPWQWVLIGILALLVLGAVLSTVGVRSHDSAPSGSATPPTAAASTSN